MAKKIIAVIPARMGSSRFPGKPLAKILDLPMIEHVRRRVELCDPIDDVYVATCDQEIMNVVQENGGKAVMTADTHERCTDRVEEAVQNLEADIVVIVQGDEPLFLPNVADILVEPMVQNENVLCTNILSTIDNEDDLQNKNIVKAVLNHDNYVLYFSRAAIPYKRVQNHCSLYRQTGLSAFRKDFLETFSNLTPTPLEAAESIDFLRMVEHGYPVLGVVFQQPTYGVDHPDDVGQIESILKEDQEQISIYKKLLQV